MKYKIISFSLSLCIGWFFCAYDVEAQEAHAAKIISKVLRIRQRIKHISPPKFIFLAFWDFDGTIMKGDCSEGLKDRGKRLYKGLAQLAIESGLSKIYQPSGGADRFWKDYRSMEHHIGRWLAYPFIPQMLRGARVQDIRSLSRQHFSAVLKNYYFRSSLRIIKALEANNINCHVISASSSLFVDGAAPTLGLPRERFNGIELMLKNGILTERLVYPVTMGSGKTEKLISIIKKIKSRNPGKRILVLAAFGNSYRTDGHFMKYVAEQNLPKGKPLAVMINGGKTPARYRGLFYKVKQSEIVLTTKSGEKKY